MTADQTEREALTLRYIESQPDSGPHRPAMPGHIAVERGIEVVARLPIPDGLAPSPTPRTVTTVEELEALPVGAVVGSRLAGGEWSVATKNRDEDGLEDYPWSVDGHGGRYSNHGVEEHLGLPAVVLTPAPAPVDREALEIRVEDAVRAAMESRQGGLTIAHGRTWGDPDDYWITLHVGPVARAALKAATS